MADESAFSPLQVVEKTHFRTGCWPILSIQINEKVGACLSQRPLKLLDLAETA